MFVGSISVLMTLVSALDSDSLSDSNNGAGVHRRRHKSSSCSYSSSSCSSDVSTRSSCSSGSSSSMSSCSDSSSTFKSKKSRKSKHSSSSCYELKDACLLTSFKPSTIKGPCDVFKFIMPFVICKGVEAGKPYAEFSFIVAFLTTIGGVENPVKLFNSRNRKLQLETVNDVNTFSNYDGLYPFYYNCDVNNGLALSGLTLPTFDFEAVSWFMNRFYYFLSIHCEKGQINDLFATLPDGRVSYAPDRKPLDLIEIPCQFVREYDESIVTIFNCLLGNRDLIEPLNIFVAALYVQIGGCCGCKETASQADTTRTVYCILLKNFISTIAGLVNYNEGIRERYFQNTKYYKTFAAIPTIAKKEAETGKPPAKPEGKYVYGEIIDGVMLQPYLSNGRECCASK